MRHTPLLLATLSILLSSCDSNQPKPAEPASEPSADNHPETTDTPTETAAPPEQPAVSTNDFFAAAHDGNLEIVQKALANPNAATHADPNGQTALMLAAFNGHNEIIETLLKHGAGVDARDKSDRTALMYGCTGPFPKTVELLIKHGANVNLADNNEHWTPLMFAAAEGQTDNVRILLNAGADPTASDIDGEDAELFAANNGFHDLAQLIHAAKLKKLQK